MSDSRTTSTAAARLAASWLLAFPDERLLAQLDTISDVVDELPADMGDPLGAFLAHLSGTPLPEIQQHYVQVFDMKRKACPYLSYWTDGDTRNRGAAILRFKQAYLDSGFELGNEELPDHLAVVLEFAAVGDVVTGEALLADHQEAILAQTLLDGHDLAAPVRSKHVHDVHRVVQDDLRAADEVTRVHLGPDVHPELPASAPDVGRPVVVRSAAVRNRGGVVAGGRPVVGEAPMGSGPPPVGGAAGAAGEPVLLQDKRDYVLTLTLNRPRVGNSLSLELIRTMQRAFDAAAQDESVRVIVIAAHGPTFCAGHDLKEGIANNNATFSKRITTACAKLMQTIVAQPQPVIEIGRAHV